MPLAAQDVDLRHHGRDIDACGHRIDFRLAVAAQRATDLPHLGAGDLAHWKTIEPMRRADDAADLVAALHLLIDFGKDVGSWAIAGAIGFLEELPTALVERLVGSEQPCCRDLLANGAGDASGRVEESVVLL